MKKLMDGPEFVDPQTVLEWTPTSALKAGAHEMVLFKDEETGTYARLLRLDPGHVGNSSPMTHDFDEVVYNLSGEIVDDFTGRVYGPNTYAVFPAGQPHGPYSCPHGSLAIEFRYYRREMQRT